MKEERPYLQIPLSSPEEQKMFEEWVERRKKQDKENDSDRGHIIVVDI